MWKEMMTHLSGFDKPLVSSEQRNIPRVTTIGRARSRGTHQQFRQNNKIAGGHAIHRGSARDRPDPIFCNVTLSQEEELHEACLVRA
jgi:hypothetical protein